MFKVIKKNDYKKTQELISTQKELISKLTEKISDLETELRICKSRKNGMEIIDYTFKKNKYMAKEEKQILNLMKKITELDLCYSNYLVKVRYADGTADLLIDTSQIPTTYKEQINSIINFINE